MRVAQEKKFVTHDGTELFYRYWPPTSGTGDKGIVLFHRGHEHSGRLQHVVDELGFGEIPFFAWDARGHGRSPGKRGYSPSFGTSVRDVDAFIRHITELYHIPVENIAVIAQSVGAVLVATWVHDYAPKVRCLVLASPGFKVKLYFPFARTGLKVLYRWFGNFYLNSYVKARFLTHDPERIESYNRDSLITRPISVNILLALYEAGERVIADAQAILTPTQLLVSGADWVVHLSPQFTFFRRLGSPIKEQHVLPGFYHDTLGEKDRTLAFEKVRDFIKRMFAQPAQTVGLLDADRSGYTKDEEARLRRPLPAFSPRNIGYVLSRSAMLSIGQLSDGIRLGIRTGFDSGSTLDYVYRNEASGITFLGRMIDRRYLDSIGWRGIRVRKAHLEEAIGEAVGQLRTQDRPVRIVDIAAGHGRYVLEAVERLAPRPELVLLRDYSEINVCNGSRLIAEKKLEGVVRFERGDAFDEKSVGSIVPRPTIAIVSGLYELFPDNAMVLASLRGLAQSVEPQGYLIYTGQPWHPQLELIARTLTSHREHQPWVMRRRTQAEMDQLVESVGFTKCGQWADEWGIFTVSLALRT